MSSWTAEHLLGHIGLYDRESQYKCVQFGCIFACCNCSQCVNDHAKEYRREVCGIQNDTHSIAFMKCVKNVSINVLITKSTK